MAGLHLNEGILVERLPADGRRIPRPEPWEHELLRLIAEQGAIPFDQLARFIGAEADQAANIAKHLTKMKFADYGRFLHGEPYWTWLTHRGTRVSGTEFGYLPPRVGAMARMRAVNEVRLHIAARAPDARWISGRTIFREQGGRGRRPNAVVEVGSEHHAIVVQVGWVAPEHATLMIETHMARYDAVIAFANAKPRQGLERLAAEHHWPKLIIRPIPQAPESHRGGPKSPPQSS